DTSRQTKNLNKLLIRILLHLQVEFSILVLDITVRLSKGKKLLHFIETNVFLKTLQVQNVR
ncbi:hypothetical protein, partial [Bacteroides uniformis]|uniref:hypothetical protein n=1 Tax=Bacteroides uniformis TaxID=820 RepID=UPI00195D8639